MSLPLPVLGSAGDEVMKDSTQWGNSDRAEESSELLLRVAEWNLQIWVTEGAGQPETAGWENEHSKY